MKKELKKRKNKYIAHTLYLFLFILFFGGIFVEFFYTKHENIIDLKIGMKERAVSSVTQRSIETNPKYKNIAFEKVPEKNYFFGTNQIASVSNFIKNYSIFGYLIRPLRENNVENERGSWIWTPTRYLNNEYTDFIIENAKERGINTIYLSIDSYLDVFVLPDGPLKNSMNNTFFENLENFVKKANQNGIEVDAEAGWKNWAEEGNEYKPFTILNFVKDYNEKSEYQFRGFQYDIEPYLLDEFDTEKERILTNFVSLVDKTENFLKDTDIRFSVVLPDFYDKKDGITPKFRYGGVNDYVIPHLVNILDERENNSIIIMSYRNYAKGKDGSIEVTKNEMRTLRRIADNTKLIVAQETGDFPPPYITFHNKDREYMYSQIKELEKKFGENPNYGGIAIHYINSYLDME